MSTFINLLRARQVLTISEGSFINSLRARSYLVTFLDRLSWLQRIQADNG